jgi:zinc/manganese transport system substrate-binding protein
MINRRSAALALVSAAFAIVSLSSAASARETKVKAVTSFSILADFVREVGGERVEVASLVGPDGDGHVFSPTPADANKVANADIMIINGLGFEGWINRLMKASRSKAAVVTASTGVQPIAGDDTHQGHDHGDQDPHAWQDVANAKIYVANIRDGLAAADPASKEIYDANATAYLARLDALDAEVRVAVARIPSERRKIIVTHDAFRYFAKAYGLEFMAPQGVSTEAEASAADVARIVRQVRTERIQALFLENVSDPRLIEQMARETGARIGGRLYSDALSGPTGPAATYIDMIRNNVAEISRALAS